MANQLLRWAPRHHRAALHAALGPEVDDPVEVGKADFLVTGDKDLLVLAAEFSRKIVTAGQLLEIPGPG